MTSNERLPDDVVLSVRNVSKKFCRNLRRSMAYGILDLSRNLVGRQPTSTELRKDEFWAVRNVSFDLKRGEVLGLVGQNGAGKSTLLRLVHGIFPPDIGVVYVKGRMDAMIALGAGFHPHMTGRENIYLNGSILGLSQDEIAERLDEIISFAEIGDFIDAPVSTYSSGMRVRLGFAIATFSEPDVLLIDEVLSVGDFTFQRKCIDRMKGLQDRGVGIIFVSHSLATMNGFCTTGILATNGEFGEKKPIAQALTDYVHDRSLSHGLLQGKTPSALNVAAPQSLEVSIEEVRLLDAIGKEKNYFTALESMKVTVRFVAKKRLPSPILGYVIVRVDSNLLCMGGKTKYVHIDVPDVQGKNEFSITIDPLQLHTGDYRLGIVIFDDSLTLPHAYVPEACLFKVISPWLEDSLTSPVVMPPVIWALNGQKLTSNL